MWCREPGVVASIKRGFRSDGGLLAFDFDWFGHGEEEDGLGLGLVDVSTRCDLFSWRMTEVLGSYQSYLFPCIFPQTCHEQTATLSFETVFHLSPSQTNSWETVAGIKGRSAIP
jgi:hypothetical protein